MPYSFTPGIVYGTERGELYGRESQGFGSNMIDKPTKRKVGEAMIQSLAKDNWIHDNKESVVSLLEQAAEIAGYQYPRSQAHIWFQHGLSERWLVETV